MRTHSRAILASAVLLASMAIVACDDDEPTGPMAEAAGTYEATVFTLKEVGGNTDLLAEGVTLTIRLNANGTTSGTFFVPDSGDGTDTHDLTGTWTLDNGMVEFDHEADTFIRDAIWTYDGDDQLSVDNSELTVVLTRR